jgi:hypothetical protein
MKFNHSRLFHVLVGALALGSISTVRAANSTRAPIVLTPPAIQDGSNASRAPFPAKRQMDDVKPADGQSIDPDVPPNTPATDIPAPPPPVVAVLQRPAGEPALTPTGRVTTTAAAAADVVRVAPGLRAMAFDSRDTLLADLSTRIDTTIAQVNANRDIMRDLTAGPRDQFKDAAAAVEERERALRHSIKLARKADAAGWEAARAQVAADYDAFAAAAANFDQVFAALRPSV